MSAIIFRRFAALTILLLMAVASPRPVLSQEQPEQEPDEIVVAAETQESRSQEALEAETAEARQRREQQAEEIEMRRGRRGDAGGARGRGRGRGARRGAFGQRFDGPEGRRRAAERQQRAVSLRQRGDAEQRPQSPEAEQAGVPLVIRIWDVTITIPAEQSNEPLSGLRQRFDSIDGVNRLIERLQGAGLVERSRQFRLQTVSGTPSSFLAGGRVPQITGSTIRGGRGGRGVGIDIGRSNSISYSDVATTVSVNSETDQSGVLIQVTYSTTGIDEDSGVVVSESTEGGDPIMANRQFTHTVESTLRLQPGSAVLVHSDLGSGGAADGGRGRLLFLGIE